MITSRVLAATVGLGVLNAGASAQTLHVNVSFADDVINIGESTTATMTATLDGWGAAAYLALVNFDLLLVHECPQGTIPSDALAASGVSGLTWGNPALGDVSTGTVDGGDLLGVFAAQHSLFGAPDQSNPITLLTWTVTGTAEGWSSYTLGAIANTPGMLAVSDPTTNPFAAPVYFSLGDAGLVFTSDTLGLGGPGPCDCVPAPGALAVLGLGGLAGGRRRR